MIVDATSCWSGVYRPSTITSRPSATYPAKFLVGDRDPCRDGADGDCARLNGRQPERQSERRRVPLDRAVLYPPGNPDVGIGHRRLVQEKLIYGKVIYFGFLYARIDQIANRTDDEQGSYQEFALLRSHVSQLTDFETLRKQSPPTAPLKRGSPLRSLSYLPPRKASSSSRVGGW